MTVTPQSQENQAPSVDAQKDADREINFARIRKQLEQERAEKNQLAQRLEQIEQERAANARKPYKDDEDDERDDEPYVDRRRLKKELSRTGEQIKNEAKQEVQQAVRSALDEERRNNYLRDNADFNEVMSPDMVQKFADKHPRLAENILRMPEGFERQKLVYENIKALGINKKEEPKQSIQQTIEANRKSPYYQPSGPGTAPYASGGNFSPSGMKDSYNKMQELKSRLRLG